MEVAELPPDVRQRFPASVPSSESLRRLVDKASFERALHDFDVPHPRTVDADDIDALADIGEQDMAHYFLKPRDSQSFIARYRVKGVRVSSIENAVRKLVDLDIPPSAMVLQEYVPGPASNHYFIDGFVDRTGTVRSMFARRRIRMSPPDFGNSSFMYTVPVSDVQPAADALARRIRGVGHRGIFSAEFKQDPRDGAFKLLEVNARAWWYVGFAVTSGVDVCHQAYLDALEMDVPEMHTYPVGRRLVYPYYDYQAYRRLRQNGAITLPQWLKSVVGASQPVFETGDPGPGLVETTGLLLRRLRSLRARSGSPE
jgi:predicted ATP-grasp superfamily ATP-dependent carboligase